MPSRHPIRRSLELLLLTALLTHAQTAEDFFHGGAMSYISNNIPAALEVVTNGMQQFPEDEKLKKLYELLNQKQQQQSQENKQQNQNQQSKNDEQKPKQDKQDQPQKNDQPKSSDQQKSQEKQREPEKQSQPAKPGDKQEQNSQEQARARPAQMTPQQAQRLLDSQKGTEQVLWFKPEGKPEDPAKPVKDW
jgi:Ca-activated chloride channel homolog